MAEPGFVGAASVREALGLGSDAEESMVTTRVKLVLLERCEQARTIADLTAKLQAAEADLAWHKEERLRQIRLQRPFVLAAIQGTTEVASGAWEAIALAGVGELDPLNEQLAAALADRDTWRRRAFECGWQDLASSYDVRAELEAARKGEQS